MNSIKNKKGFTLIEILAVIIILGILLLIAIPSISKYIENSRKNTYINSVKSMVNAVSAAVNAMELPYSLGKNEGMIIPFSEIELEKKGATTKSPYSKWIPEKSFILVVFDGEMYKYYVSALDETGYAIPLVHEKVLSTSSITTDSSIINANSISYEDVKKASSSTVFETNAVTFAYLKHSGNIVKVKVGASTYAKGDIIQLKDGSKWFATMASSIDEDRVSLVSYYSMAINSENYGKQDSNNPAIRFHNSQQNPAIYDSNASIYPVAEQIVAATQVELVKNGINMQGSTVKMPELSDFGCSTTSSTCRSRCFHNKENISFWTTDTKGEWVYTITSVSRGQANTESTGFGIRIVVKDILKSNIDKQATKALN